MLFSISSLYTSILVFILLFLSARIIHMRMSKRIGIGDKQDLMLAVAIRAQGNFIEYVPITLLLLVIFESNFGSSIYVHIIGMSLCLSRILHAWGLISAAGGADIRRAMGVVINFMILAVLAILNLVFFFGQLVYGYG